MAASEQAPDHDEIRRWPDARDGSPARARATGDGDDTGILRIDFPGGAGEDEHEHISGDEWFEKFDQQGLAAIIQEEKTSGESSTFIKLVNR